MDRMNTLLMQDPTRRVRSFTPHYVKLIVDSLALRNHRDVRVGDSTRVGVKKKAKALCCVMPYWSHDDDTSDEDVTRPEGPSVDTVAQPRDSTRSHVDLVEVVLSCRVGYISERSKDPTDVGWSGRVVRSTTNHEPSQHSAWRGHSRPMAKPNRACVQLPVTIHLGKPRSDASLSSEDHMCRALA